MPHVSMMRDSQTRAPNLWSARLDGISRMMYPMKNTPEASPNWAAVMPRSCSIPLGPAYPIAVRSRKLMKNISATNGTSRTEILWTADLSTAGFTIAVLDT